VGWAGLMAAWCWVLVVAWRESREPRRLVASAEGLALTNLPAAGSNAWWPRDQVTSVTTRRAWSLFPPGRPEQLLVRRRRQVMPDVVFTGKAGEVGQMADAINAALTGQLGPLEEVATGRLH
jgi:hypothetical protein